MAKLKIAVLEDSPVFLKELVDNLKRTDLVEVLINERSSEPFVDKVRALNPEALLLDIHLAGEGINGIQIAEILKLPVLFLSAERRHYLEEIDKLKLLGTFPVEEIGKTPDPDKLRIILKSFIPRVRDYQKNQKVWIKPKGEDKLLITPSDVVLIETIKNEGDHQMNFNNRKPIVVADKKFEFFKENGFNTDKFYQLDRAYLVSITHAGFNPRSELLEVEFINARGVKEKRELPVPEEKRKEVKRLMTK